MGPGPATLSSQPLAKALASVIGEDELSPNDKLLLKFGEAFEARFINQGYLANRSIEETLDLGWELLSMLPREELDRLDEEMLAQHYIEERDEA